MIKVTAEMILAERHELINTIIDMEQKLNDLQFFYNNDTPQGEVGETVYKSINWEVQEVTVC